MDPVLENVLVELLVDLPADADIPVVASAPERTWLWSDLHLSDPSVLLGWGRPFGSVEEMNRHLLRNWRRRVGASDTVICLGDVAHPDAWRDDRLVLDLAECPGERLLVLGNHDVDPVNHGAAARGGPDRGHAGRARRAAAAPDPRAAAAGAGRLRERARARAPERVAEQDPAHQRECRAVELPARESERHQAAGPPAAGRKNRPRSQHQGTAEHRGNHHAMTTAEAIRDETSLVPQTMGWTPVPVRGRPRWPRRIPT